MLQILFRIPISVTAGGFEIPLFGAGLLLAFWGLVGGAMLVVAAVRGARGNDLFARAGTWLGGAVLIWFIPRIWPDGIPIFGYGAMLFIGFLASAGLAAWRAKRQGWEPAVIWDVSMLLLAAGIVGGRLFFVIQYHERFDSLGDVLNISNGGLVYYGGVIGAVAAFAVYTRWKRLPALALCDLLAPSVALGLAFGRVGCFLNGCCYGAPTSLPWAVHFPHGSVPYGEMLKDGLLEAGSAYTPGLHPTQIYSAMNGLVLCLLLSAFYPWRRRDGQVIALLLTAYPVTRFLIEFLRADELPIGGTPFSISQNVSMILFLASLAFWYWLQRRPLLGGKMTAHASGAC